MKNIIKITILGAVVFFLAISVWYSLVLFKGYAPYGVEVGTVILGRNLAQTGVYGAENDLNVLLSSNLVKNQAHISAQGNKLAALLYGEFFKIMGPLSEENLVLFSISLHALSLVIFTLTIFYLFGFKLSLIFSLIYILLPFIWQLPYHLGTYEFALLFFSFFFLFYLCGIKQKRNYIYLGISGIFFALACLSRETLLLFAPFLFIYLWTAKQKRYLLYIFIPFIALFGCLWLPNALMTGDGGNVNLLHFTTNAPEKLKSADFSRYGHLFPDPYTYHFNKEEFLKDYQNQLDSEKIDFSTKAYLIKSASNIGIRSPGFLERIKVGLVLFSDHLLNFFSLEKIGGPFIFLLMILGIYSLRQKNKYLYVFALGWIFSTIFLLSFFILAARSHLMDFGWVIALFISLGLTTLIKILNEYFGFKQKKSIILSIIIIVMLLHHLLLINHTAWHKLFDRHRIDSLVMVYSQKIEEFNVPDESVIACPLEISHLYRLNYLNNKSLVIFRIETIEDLLDNGKLNSAFEKFEVKYILGYPDELSKKIINQTQSANITNNLSEFSQINASPNKVWLLDLIR